MAKPLYSTTICVLIAVLYLLESATVSSGIGEVCNFGSTEVPETNFLDDNGQYLDFGHPATCTGNLTAWHYCYYAADITESDTYTVEFRIWRMGNGNSFDRIHNYLLSMEIDPLSNNETLICETATLNLSTPLDVQENDILGAYIPLTRILGGRRLNIVARDTADFGLFVDTRSAGTAFTSTTLRTNNLEMRTTLGLHLYADIAVDCVDLADPMNGQVTITPDVMATFDTDLCAVATYTCSEGYSLVGDAMRTCQANGQWNGTEPTCEVIDCGGLTDPGDGQVAFTPGVVMTLETGLNAVATYACSEGYSLVGDVMRTCQANGQWNGTEPTCEVIDCGDLTDPEDGQVIFTPGVVATIDTGLVAVATYTCSEGYSLVGDATRTCQANSQWDGAEPSCMLIDCGGLNDPVGGDVTITPAVVESIETGLNAVAMYTCNEGYDLVGNTMRSCQESNQWDGTEPMCTLIDCGNLTDPEGGQVTFAPGVVMTLATGLDAMATYICNSSAGYMLFDNGESPTRTCQASGWSGGAATCTRCDFSTLTDPENGRFFITTTGGEIMARYTCEVGYQLVGDAVLACQSDGQFSRQEPECDVIDCDLLPLPSEGQVDYTPGVVTSLETGLNATASYSCSEGYDLDGDAMRTCQANGQWDGAEPMCMLINCGLLPPPSEGQVAYTPSPVTGLETGLNAMANYSCSEGYDLIGDMIRTCQANGEWDGAAPTCMLIDCGGLGDPDNGRVVISPGLVPVTMTGVGAVATYTCNTSAGFMLVGTPMRTCQDSGQWSGMAPECIRCNTSSITAPGNGSVAITSPGGMITASYTCDVGYSVVGVASRTCQSDGQFSGQEPVCQIIDCGSPPRIDNGTFNVTMTTFESMAQYSCNEGFTLSGSQSRTCQADGTWSGADLMCRSPAKQSNSSPVITGVVVGLLVAALIALGIIVVIILRRRRQRKGGVNIVTSSNENRFEDLSNPIYSGEIDGRYVGIAGTGSTTYVKSNDYDEVAGDDAYEMTGIVQPAGTLTSMNSDYDDIVDPHRSSNLVITNPSRMEPQHYELPQRRNIYSTMSDNSQVRASPYEEPVESARNSYEWGIHVPTKEQREVLTMSGENSAGDSGAYGTDENVYAALAEVQRATTLSLPSTPITFFEESDTYWAPSSNPSELYEQLAVKKYREIPRNQIQIVEHLGAGQFGTVNKGIWQTAEKTVEIAVKMLKVGAGENDKVKFLQEAAINGQFRHPNIVKLLGVVTVGNPVMIVLEFLANGDLKGYLTKQRPVPGELLPSQMPRIFLGFCRQVACGMEYLSKKAFVHRDLAARNVLVSENKICKISDFGMSRDLMDENYYVSHGGKVPVKWTAPEALHFKKYTTASDVWSYGAVMYEIWSLGHKPFKGYTNQEAIKLVDDGFRLPPPPGCPKKLYSLMIQCWHPKKSSRPSFLQIVTALSESELELLCWTEKDIEAHPQAMLLGAPLEAGRNLYPELQGAYK